MTSVFLGGSRKLSRLNKDIKGRVQNIINQQYQILIGDANGSDKAIQKYLVENNYRYVTVFCTGSNCRNNLGKWKSKSITPEIKTKNFKYYTLKDKEMSKLADYGFMLWDGKSAGTLNNIMNLLNDNKKILTYFAPEKIFYTILTTSDLILILNKCIPSELEIIDRKINFKKTLSKLQGTININDFVESFANCNRIFREFGATLAAISLDEERQAFELYCLLALKICQKKSKAISLLLKNELYSEAIVISRQIMELLFNLNWIEEADNKIEQNNRAYELEAEPYYNFSKEIRSMIEDSKSDNPIWSFESVKENMTLFENEKEHFPSLIKDNENGTNAFKNPPPFVQRMGRHLRVKYYHIYRFSSMFVHPSPKLKEFLLNRKAISSTPNEMIVDSLRQILAYTLLFNELILGFCIERFKDFNNEHILKRDKLYKELVGIVDNANKGYFGKPR